MSMHDTDCHRFINDLLSRNGVVPDDWAPKNRANPHQLDFDLAAPPAVIDVDIPEQVLGIRVMITYVL
jgi:hypothetical protein